MQYYYINVKLENERGSNQTSTFPLRPPIKLDTTKSIIIGSPYSFSIGLTGDYELAKYFELVAGKPIAGPDGTVGGIMIVTKSDGMEKMALLNYHDVGDVFEGIIEDI